MYSKIKTLEIGKMDICFQNIDSSIKTRIKLSTPIEYNDKFFLEEKFINAVDDDNTQYKVKCFKNNIYIYKSTIELVCKIYVPQKVKYLINKDINTKKIFTLEYRKHLKTEFSCEKHIFLAFNYIPENFENLIEKARNICKTYSTGIYNQPILCCYFDNENERLFYGIIKDNIPVESGYLCLPPNVW